MACSPDIHKIVIRSVEENASEIREDAFGMDSALGKLPADSDPTKLWVGQPIARVEDPALLTGRGRFIDDIGNLPRHVACGDPALAPPPCRRRRD